MATTIVTSAYQDLEVTFNEEGWFNATSVAERFGKEVTFWLNQRETVEYIAALASQLGKINSYTVQELNLIKQLESSSAASRAALLAFAKKTGWFMSSTVSCSSRALGSCLRSLGQTCGAIIQR